MSDWTEESDVRGGLVIHFVSDDRSFGNADGRSENGFRGVFADGYYTFFLSLRHTSEEIQ